ncbi:MAG TPA: hypothetical protein VG370_27210 [Chloroflexota bacterium]|nr:hypothetical protein [Chloroflexota bacterium]
MADAVRILGVEINAAFWTALATIVASVSVFMVWRTLREMQRQRLDAHRPVIVFLPDEYRAPEFSLAYRNVGPGPAIDVMVAVSLPGPALTEALTIGTVAADPADRHVAKFGHVYHHRSERYWDGAHVWARYRDVFGREHLARADLIYADSDAVDFGPVTFSLVEGPEWARRWWRARPRPRRPRLGPVLGPVLLAGALLVLLLAQGLFRR